MYALFIERCDANAAFLPIDSLNRPRELEVFDIDAGEIGDLVADPTTPTEVDLLFTLMLPLVADFVRTLPPRLRETVYRHYWNGQSQTTIAQELNMSQSGVSRALESVLRRGRKCFGLVQH